MKKYEKLFISVLTLALIVLVSAEPVLAFINTNTDPIENVFKTVKVETEIDEDFDKDEKKDVVITNLDNGKNIDSYIRVALTPAWVDSEGNIASVTPVLGTDYELDLDLENGWIKGDDGFYYYTKIVKPDDSTTVLVELCKPIVKNGDLKFELNVASSAIQANPKTVVESEWNVTVNAEGILGGVNS